MNIEANKKALKPMVSILIFILIMAWVISLGFLGQVTFDLNLKSEDYTGMLMHLGVVAILIERFVEVYNAIWRLPGRLQLELKLEQTTEDARQEVEQELTKYRSETGVSTMYMAFATGLLVSLGGIHVLEVMFDATELNGIQQWLFRGLDVVITGGLLAGGSKGINKISSLISTGLTTTEKNIKQRGMSGP